MDRNFSSVIFSVSQHQPGVEHINIRNLFLTIKSLYLNCSRSTYDAEPEVFSGKFVDPTQFSCYQFSLLCPLTSYQQSR